MDEALYNPALLSLDPQPAFGANTPLFTTATLTMVFDKTPTLNDSAQWSPFVRMRRVGINAQGSLRLPGNGNGDPIEGVPEPATLGLLGLGMLAMGALRRRKVALKG